MNKGLLLATALGTIGAYKETMAAPSVAYKRLTPAESSIGWQKPADGNGIIKSELDKNRKKLTVFVTPRAKIKLEFSCPDPAVYNDWKALDADKAAIPDCNAGKCVINLEAAAHDNDTVEIPVMCAKGDKNATTGNFEDEELLTATVHTTTPGNYADPIIIRSSTDSTSSLPEANFKDKLLFNGHPLSLGGGVAVGNNGMGPYMQAQIGILETSDARARLVGGAFFNRIGSSGTININGRPSLPFDNAIDCGGIDVGGEYDFVSGENARCALRLSAGAGLCHTSEEIIDGKTVEGFTNPAFIPGASLTIGARKMQIRAGVQYVLGPADAQNGLKPLLGINLIF